MYAFVERGQTHHLTCISHHILVENLAGNLLRRSWSMEGNLARKIFALMFVFCNATQVHALHVKHLHHHVCVLVGRKPLPQGALIVPLFLPVANIVINYLSVGVIGVEIFVMLVHVILVRF